MNHQGPSLMVLLLRQNFLYGIRSCFFNLLRCIQIPCKQNTQQTKEDHTYKSKTEFEKVPVKQTFHILSYYTYFLTKRHLKQPTHRKPSRTKPSRTVLDGLVKIENYSAIFSSTNSIACCVYSEFGSIASALLYHSRALLYSFSFS